MAKYCCSCKVLLNELNSTGSKTLCRECRRLYNKKYRDEHKEATFLTCECGKKIISSSLYHHKKSKFHIAIMTEKNLNKIHTFSNITAY